MKTDFTASSFTKQKYPVIDPEPDFSKVVDNIKTSDIFLFFPGLVAWGYYLEPKMKGLVVGSVVGVLTGYQFAFVESHCRLTGLSKNDDETYPDEIEAAAMIPKVRTQGGTSRGEDKGKNAYQVEFPEESHQRLEEYVPLRLDLATEKDLIQTWNNRFNLKRTRPDGFSIEELEEELVKRKKQKKEAWYDADGQLIAVSVSTIHGKHSFLVGDREDLEALAP